MKDIETREDLEMMLTAFYEKVFNDDLISHFFIEVVPLRLDHHLPLITDFWESVLLNAQGYRRNVMEIHLDIHKKSPLEKQHLDRWVQLFTKTVDHFFDGPKAILAKQRAQSIATMMGIKISQSNSLLS